MQFAEDEIENLFTGTTHILHTTGKAHIVAGVVGPEHGKPTGTSWDTTVSRLIRDPRQLSNSPNSFRPQARTRGDDYVNCYSATIGMQQQYHARTYYVLGAEHHHGLVNGLSVDLIKNILTQGGNNVTLPNNVQYAMP